MPARITIMVKTFRQIATTAEPTRYCAVRTTLDDPGPQNVEFKQEGDQIGGRLMFKEKGDLVIKVVPRPDLDPVKHKYVPLGIAFRRKLPVPTAGEDVIGRDLFVRAALDVNGDSSLTIHNNFSADEVTYEFYIMIQRVSDGALGIIDPDIENKDQD